MTNDDMQMTGNFGCYADDNNVISFQVGGARNGFNFDIDPEFNSTALAGAMTWLSVSGFNVAARGANNLQVEEVTSDFNNNRLLLRLISKQVNMLYGHGPAVYRKQTVDGKDQRVWVEDPDIMSWLENWTGRGMEMDYKSFSKAVIKNFYYFRDFFVKWRMAAGGLIGQPPRVAGLEVLENKHCRLATARKDVTSDLVNYGDLKYVTVGKWGYGISNYKFYPRFTFSDLDKIKYAGISHHHEKSVGEYYGVNETHFGTKSYIKGSNQTAGYINSFLKNSLAAKIHIIIPNAWINAKRQQIKALCQENKKHAAENKTLLKYNGIDIGTEYKESSLLTYMRLELRKISEYLSGEDGQGKAYATLSYESAQKNGEEARWKIETVDLKYKEYISALIEYDKRADEAMLSAVGLDPSISSVTKDGVFNKSGADIFYNYVIYLMSLNSDDETCSEPFNMALQVNFPKLYAQGFRIGFYREMPSRQEEISVKDRLQNQQS
ncbi:MAG: hypothetical protein LBL33_08440 [Tannerella sp.]|jgi:hypothetical protein|nr:hypothetical protein [Tannerella sp.]